MLHVFSVEESNKYENGMSMLAQFKKKKKKKPKKKNKNDKSHLVYFPIPQMVSDTRPVDRLRKMGADG